MRSGNLLGTWSLTAEIQKEVFKSEPIITEEITVYPKTTQQIVKSSEGKYINKVTVEPVTSSIDYNISSGNIKKGVGILGVIGTLEVGLTQDEADSLAEAKIQQYVATAIEGSY